MTTRPDGGQTSTIVNNAVVSVGAGYSEALVRELISKEKSKVAVPINTTDLSNSQTHNIYLGTLCVSIKPEHAAKTGIKSLGAGLRDYGRVIVVGDVGGIPHGVDDAVLNSMSEDEKERYKREKTLEGVTFVGAANGNYTRGTSTEANGVAVFVSGPVSVAAFTPKLIRPGAEVRLAIPQASSITRAGMVKTSEMFKSNTPFTIEEIDKKGPIPLMKQALYSIITRVAKTSSMSKNVEHLPADERDMFYLLNGINMIDVNKANPAIAGRIDEMTKSVADVTSKAIIELAVTLIESGALNMIVAGITSMHTRHTQKIGRVMGIDPQSLLEQNNHSKTYDIFLTP